MPDSLPELVAFTQVPAAPARPADAHKGTFGTVIVVGGSATMIGAPALAASAALRTGTGLVKIATIATFLPAALIVEPSATGILLENDPAVSLDRLLRQDPQREAVLAVGPGMGRGEPAARILERLVREKWRMVLDADGLNLLAQAGRPRLSGAPLVLTPHPGEFRRLAQVFGISESPTEPAQRPIAAAKLARALQAVVVLKGQHTVVCDGQRLYVNTTGNPALATAGTGDVLTGVIASLMGQGLAAFEAAVLGVYLHGLAGDLWAARYGPSGLTARELAALLPEAMHQHRAGSRLEA